MPLLILTVALAVWTVLAVLNQGVWARFVEAKAVVDMGTVLNKHACSVEGCKLGFDPVAAEGLVKTEKVSGYAFTWTVAAYESKRQYLPAVLTRTKNSYVCAGQVTDSHGFSISPAYQADKAGQMDCAVTPPAVTLFIKQKQIAPKALFIYQKLS